MPLSAPALISRHSERSAPVCLYHSPPFGECSAHAVEESLLDFTATDSILPPRLEKLLQRRRRTFREHSRCNFHAMIQPRLLEN